VLKMNHLPSTYSLWVVGVHPPIQEVPVNCCLRAGSEVGDVLCTHIEHPIVQHAATAMHSAFECTSHST
jgi:hypothetical protein